MKTEKVRGCRIHNYHDLLLLVLIGSVAFSGPVFAEGGTQDHSGFSMLQQEFETASDVTKACLICHDEDAEEMMGTTHWTWEYETKDGQKLGKNNVINNYCVAVSSNWARCTSCHVGYGYKDNESFVAMDKTKVDCLVCHDQTGQYKKFPTGAGEPTYTDKMFPGGPGAPYAKPWKAVDLAASAQSVALPTRKNCGSCHFSGGGGPDVKHGDLDTSMVNPTFETDVHMDVNGLNYSCQECHVTSDHQIAGSRYEMDLQGHTRLKSCKTCHKDHEHESAMIDGHTDQIACQTCHIPQYAKEKYVKKWWDWSTAGELKDGTGDFEGKKVWKVVKDPNTGMKTYMSPKGTFEWDKQIAPSHAWFNGNTTYITLDDSFDPNTTVAINTLQGNMDDPNAVIFPVHSFEGMQPYDAVTNKLVVPNLFPSPDYLATAYWKNWDWAKAIAGGQASVGREFSGEYGFVKTKMVWPLTHQVSPKEKALKCQDCHTPNGAVDFAALGYSEQRIEKLMFYPAD